MQLNVNSLRFLIPLLSIRPINCVTWTGLMTHIFPCEGKDSANGTSLKEFDWKEDIDLDHLSLLVTPEEITMSGFITIKRRIDSPLKFRYAIESAQMDSSRGVIRSTSNACIDDHKASEPWSAFLGVFGSCPIMPGRYNTKASRYRLQRPLVEAEKRKINMEVEYDNLDYRDNHVHHRDCVILYLEQREIDNKKLTN